MDIFQQKFVYYFVGHLAGILVGLAYARGPLKYTMDVVYNTGSIVALLFKTKYNINLDFLFMLLLYISII